MGGHESRGGDVAPEDCVQYLSGSRVPHVRQSASWDCGLACVGMVLRAVGQTECVSEAALAAECGTRSPWSIDLAYLLHRHGVVVEFTTLRAGVSDDYVRIPFYAPSFASDAVRVKKLFEEASIAGLRGSVPLTTLRVTLAHRTSIFVVLVDARELHCTSCMLSAEQLALRLIPSYVGHYIVLCGWREGVFEVRNPGRAAASCFMTEATIEAARRAVGTDQDILQIDSGM